MLLFSVNSGKSKSNHIYYLLAFDVYYYEAYGLNMFPFSTILQYLQPIYPLDADANKHKQQQLYFHRQISPPFGTVQLLPGHNVIRNGAARCQPNIQRMTELSARSPLIDVGKRLANLPPITIGAGSC